MHVHLLKPHAIMEYIAHVHVFPNIMVWCYKSGSLIWRGKNASAINST